MQSVESYGATREQCVHPSREPKRDDLYNTTGEFLTTVQLALLLQMNVQVVEQWRKKGFGPPFIRVGGRRVLYARADLDAWLASRRFQHAAEEAAQRSGRTVAA